MKKKFLYIITIGILLFNLSACDTAEPTASFSISTTEGSSEIKIINNSINDYFYLWDFGDGEESSEREPNHTYTGAGSYTVQLTVFSKNGKFKDTETNTLVVENKNNEITYYSYGGWTTRAGYYRKTYFDNNDFNFSYPVSITKTTHMFKSNDTWGSWDNIYYKFIIYDNSSTIIHQSQQMGTYEPADTITVEYTLSSPITVDSDFYICVYIYGDSPYSTIEQVSYNSGHSYYSEDGNNWTKYNYDSNGFEYATSVFISENKNNNKIELSYNKK